MSRLQRVPRPPPRKPEGAPESVDEDIGELWRLHWEPDPRKPQRRPVGRARFDAPLGEYGVAYSNADRHGCFAEVYGDQRSIAPREADRRLSVLRASQPLRLLTLDDGETLAALKLDLGISASVDYERTMLWSQSLHDWYQEADGIRYLGRRAAKKLNYCLFLDRCAEKLTYETQGKLGELHEHVLCAADAYGLAPRLFEARDPGFPL